MKRLNFLFTAMLVVVMAFGLAGIAAAHHDDTDVAALASGGGIDTIVLAASAAHDLQTATDTDHKSVKAGMSENLFDFLKSNNNILLDDDTAGVMVGISGTSTSMKDKSFAGTSGKPENTTNSAQVLGGCTCFNLGKPATT